MEIVELLTRCSQEACGQGFINSIFCRVLCGEGGVNVLKMWKTTELTTSFESLRLCLLDKGLFLFDDLSY